jgi:hypothetical protein
VARDDAPDAGGVIDATLGTGPTAVTVEADGVRESVSMQDVLAHSGCVSVPDGRCLSREALRTLFGGEDIRPVSTDQKIRALNEILGIELTIQTLRRHVLRRDPARIGVMSVIDAAFPVYAGAISSGERGEDLRDVFRDIQPVEGTPWLGMDGAAADGWSRLVLVYDMPRSDSRSQLRFELHSEGQMQTNHSDDDSLPLGSLSLDGFDDSGPTDNLVVPMSVPTDAFGGKTNRRQFIAVYTPPTFFPFDPTSTRPGASKDLTIVVKDLQDNVLNTAALRLVRPPVMVLHGLFGNGAHAVSNAFRDYLTGKGLILIMPDYFALNVSGFDRTLEVIPTSLKRIRAAYRDKADPLREDCDLCLIGDKSPLRGKKIALTKTDATPHSMGGVLVRWYTTEQLTSAGQQVARSIHYPPNADPATGVRDVTVFAGAGYPPLQTGRPNDSYRYKRVDNFRQGDLGSVIVYGSPLRGSPIANAVTHDRCHDDRACYEGLPTSWDKTVVQLTLALQRGPLQNLLTPSAPDRGAGVYDMSMGSKAYDLFHQYPSEPVRIHALATTSETDNPTKVQILTALSDPERYCPGFGGDSSDRIVPLASQMANLTHATPFPGAWHNKQDSLAAIQDAIADLLIDAATDTSDPADRFDPSFAADPAFPFQCTE